VRLSDRKEILNAKALRAGIRAWVAAGIWKVKLEKDSLQSLNEEMRGSIHEVYISELEHVVTLIFFAI